MASNTETMVLQCPYVSSASRSYIPLANSSTFAPFNSAYYSAIVPSIAPGIALSALSLLCLLFFIVWLFIQYCVCCAKCVGRSPDHDDHKNAQFMKEETNYSANAFGQTVDTERGCTCTKVTQTLIVALMLATVGMSSWGIAASIQKTATQIPNFWSAVDTVQQKVDATDTLLASLNSDVNTVSIFFQALQNDPAVSQIFPSGFDLNTLSTAADQTAKVQNVIPSFRQFLQNAVNGSIVQMENTYKPPSESFQLKDRYVAIAVVFGFTILFALAAGLLSLQVRFPKWASFCVAFLWFTVAILMLIGVGILQGLKRLGNDSCTYSEAYLLTTAQTLNIQGLNGISPQLLQQMLDNSLRYYFTPANLNPSGSVLVVFYAATGIDLTPVYNLINSQAVGQVLSYANQTVGLASGVLKPATVSAIQAMSGVVQDIDSAVQQFDNITTLPSVLDLYTQAKNLLCCDFAAAAGDLFVVWTVVGCLAFSLAVLCSWRIVRSSHVWQ